jgi:hypothetical protein
MDAKRSTVTLRALRNTKLQSTRRLEVGQFFHFFERTKSRHEFNQIFVAFRNQASDRKRRKVSGEYNGEQRRDNNRP